MNKTSSLPKVGESADVCMAGSSVKLLTDDLTRRLKEDLKRAQLFRYTYIVYY